MKILLLILLFVTAFSCKGQDAKYVDYDTYPYLIGGLDSLYTAISKNTILEESWNCSEGRVFVEYIVTKESKITDVNIIKGICKEADSIAIEIVSSLIYLPAEYKGKPIDSRRTIPIYFTKNE